MGKKAHYLRLVMRYRAQAINFGFLSSTDGANLGRYLQICVENGWLVRGDTVGP